MALLAPVALAAAVALSAGPAGAADAEGRFAVKGAGGATCQDFVTAREQQDNRFYYIGGWIEGYITGANRYEDGTYDIAPWQSLDLLIALIGNFCEGNPDRALHEVTAALVDRLKPRRMTQAEQRTAVGSGDQQVRVYPTILRRAQEALRRAGHYDGAIDGKYGPNTRGALRSYQQANGLEVTGLPDQRTLYNLLLKPS
jgi:hypothetical protein